MTRIQPRIVPLRDVNGSEPLRDDVSAKPKPARVDLFADDVFERAPVCKLPGFGPPSRTPSKPPVDPGAQTKRLPEEGQDAGPPTRPPVIPQPPLEPKKPDERMRTMAIPEEGTDGGTEVRFRTTALGENGEDFGLRRPDPHIHTMALGEECQDTFRPGPPSMFPGFPGFPPRRGIPRTGIPRQPSPDPILRPAPPTTRLPDISPERPPDGGGPNPPFEKPIQPEPPRYGIPVKPPVTDVPPAPHNPLAFDEVLSDIHRMRGTPAARDPAKVQELIDKLGDTHLAKVGDALSALLENNPHRASAAFDFLDATMLTDPKRLEQAMKDLGKSTSTSRVFDKAEYLETRHQLNDLRQAMLETLPAETQRRIMEQITAEPIVLLNNFGLASRKVDASGLFANGEKPSFHTLNDFLCPNEEERPGVLIPFLDTSPLLEAFVYSQPVIRAFGG